MLSVPLLGLGYHQSGVSDSGFQSRHQHSATYDAIPLPTIHPCDHPQQHDRNLASLSSSWLRHSSFFCSFNTLHKQSFRSNSHQLTKYASRRARPHVQQWRQRTDQQVDERACWQEDRRLFQRDCKILPSLQAMPVQFS